MFINRADDGPTFVRRSFRAVWAADELAGLAPTLVRGLALAPAVRFFGDMSRETDLYAPIKAFLTRAGWEVKGEVDVVDVMARRGDETLIVELKKGFSLALFHQGIDRLALTDHVYLAVPMKSGKPFARALKDNVKLARRLGLGIITVRARDAHVEVHCEPGPYAPRKSKRKQQKLLKAFDRLKGDPNDGGATRHGLVTGYRQDALRCARFLAVHGASKGSKVKDWAEVPDATRIMRSDHYGWFQRVETGVYDLTDAGRKGLKDWADV